MRLSKKVIEAVSPTQFHEAMAAYANAEESEREIDAMLQSEMARIREKYAGELAWLQEQKVSMAELIQTYCREQKSILFSKRRSLSTLYGTVGFRLGTPKLKTLKGSNWPSVLTQLKERLPQYVRTIEEPAKDLLLSDRTKEHLAPLLKEIGLQVVQEETFFIELKKSLKIN